MYLGSDQFVDDTLCKLNMEQSVADNPKPQKLSAPKPLACYEEQYGMRNEAMVQAYLSGHFTLAEVGAHFGVSYATVSRTLKGFEGRM